jgi:TolB-like protein
LLGVLLLVGAGSPCFAQNVLSFEDAFNTVLTYLTERIEAGATVAVLNFQSDYPNLSEYMIDDITSSLVNTDRYTIVDRRSLEVLAQEMAFQLSGEVSDETALSIGRRLGAQTVISGAITYLGEFYRLRVQAIEVETARIQGSQTLTIQPNRLLATLTGNSFSGPAEPEYVAPAPVVAEPPREILSWANKWLYFGIRGSYSLRMYELSDSVEGIGDDAPPSFEVGAQLSLQLTRVLALQVEALYTHDYFQYDYDYGTLIDHGGSFAADSLMLPALIKLAWRSPHILFALFGGAYMTIPMGSMEYNSIGFGDYYEFSVPVGITGGLNFGVKLGPGALFLDARYSRDMGNTSISDDYGTLAVYSRSMVSFSLGYEFGLINRK